jgi:hypothetical protein
MTNEQDGVVGTIQLNRSTSLVFSVRPWNGRTLAHVRKFVSGGKYKGPTKSGLAMSGMVLVSLIDVLTRLKAEPPRAEEKQFAKVHKAGNIDIAVTVIPPDDLRSLPSVDVREYVDSESYIGPTKKGVRFAWDKLVDVIGLLKTQAQELGAIETAEPVLFPEAHPEWVPKPQENETAKNQGSDGVLQALLPNGPKAFPHSFVDETKETTKLNLPVEPISVVVLPGGKHAVQSDLGFRHEVRNPTEGNFIYYAQLRGLTTVAIPIETFSVFKTVKAYENYLRELRSAMLKAYERKSGHRPMAEHQTREAFKSYGFPWID